MPVLEDKAAMHNCLDSWWPPPPNLPQRPPLPNLLQWWPRPNLLPSLSLPSLNLPKIAAFGRKSEGSVDEVEVFAVQSWPSSSPHFLDTVLLDPKQQWQLAHWIREADPPKGQSFELLFRSTRDGFCKQAFHKLCDEKGPTVVVARKSDGDLFGGYTEMSWNTKKGWKQCRRAFLFTYASSTSGPQACKYPVKIPDRGSSKYPVRGILCDSNHGVTFGKIYGYELQDMALFKCGASKEFEFCPGRGYSATPQYADQVEVCSAPSRSETVLDSIPQDAVFDRSKSPKPVQPQAGPLPEPPLPEETKCSDRAMPVSEGHACSHSGNLGHARFCMHCGQPLERRRSRSRSPHLRGKLGDERGGLDLEIVGFKLPYEDEQSDHGDETVWDHFRGHLLQQRARNPEVKEEIEEIGDVVTVPIDLVHNLQTRISRTFRDGRSLEDTIWELRNRINHLEHPNFVLRVAKSSLNGCDHYWTFDHRRLFCMKEAGKQLVRVRIELASPVFDEFVRKGQDRLGCDDRIRVNGRFPDSFGSPWWW